MAFVLSGFRAAFKLLCKITYAPKTMPARSTAFFRLLFCTRKNKIGRNSTKTITPLLRKTAMTSRASARAERAAMFRGRRPALGISASAAAFDRAALAVDDTTSVCTAATSDSPLLLRPPRCILHSSTSTASIPAVYGVSLLVHSTYIGITGNSP